MYLAKIRSCFDSVGTLTKDERYAVWEYGPDNIPRLEWHVDWNGKD